MKNRYSISVVVPVYNEAQLFKGAIIKIDNFLKSNFDDYEIIVIESGSTDGSFEIADEIEQNLKCVKVIHEGVRNGFGSAVKLGYCEAGKDLVLLQTVDFCFEMQNILIAVPFFDEYDCVLSYRSADNRSIGIRFRSLVYRSIVRYVLGLKMKDVNSAFKCFKTEVVKKIDILSNGWFIDAEIIYKLQNQNISYTEIPIKLIDRKDTKSSVNWFTPFFMLKEFLYFLKVKDNNQ